jgi:hypothetical protein
VISCQPVENNTRNESSHIEIVREDAKVDSSDIELKFNIIKRYSEDITSSSYDLIEIEHDNCRYLIVEGYGETLEFMHKPNCKNKH